MTDPMDILKKMDEGCRRAQKRLCEICGETEATDDVKVTPEDRRDGGAPEYLTIPPDDEVPVSGGGAPSGGLDPQPDDSEMHEDESNMPFDLSTDDPDSGIDEPDTSFDEFGSIDDEIDTSIDDDLDLDLDL